MGRLKPCCPRLLVGLWDSKTKEQNLRLSCCLGRHLCFQIDTVPVVQISHWGTRSLHELVTEPVLSRRVVLSTRQVKCKLNKTVKKGRVKLNE